VLCVSGVNSLCQSLGSTWEEKSGIYQGKQEREYLSGIVARVGGRRPFFWVFYSAGPSREGRSGRREDEEDQIVVCEP
jgi:hypothetical protein